MSLRERIRAQAKGLDSKDVRVEEWGETVRVMEMSGRERAEWQAEVSKIQAAEVGNEMAIMRRSAVLIRRTVRDVETGELAFTTEDDEWLLGQSPKVILHLASVSAEISAIGGQGLERAVGESGAVPSGSSSSASR